MANESFMDRFRSFLGIRQEPPRNDFRNPIWSSDDEDDGDDLYTRQNIEVFTAPEAMHQEFAKHMQDMFKSFGSMFGDIRVLLTEDHFESMSDDPNDVDPENFNSKSIRDYYLKPGFHNEKNEQPKEDIDLDGKVSSHEILGLLKQKDEGNNSKKPGSATPFNGNLVPGRSFCQTIITTSVTKSDGTIETRRIIKNGNEVIEETTTSHVPDTTGPLGSSMDAMTNSGLIYTNVMSELSSLFKNFY